MLKKLLFQDKEYRTLSWVMILSIAAGIAEYVSMHSGSIAMGIAVIHMGFHVAFFGGMLATTFLQRNGYLKRTKVFYRVDRAIDWIAIIVIVTLVGVRIYTFAHSNADSILHDQETFRLYCFITIVFLIMQTALLHANELWTCTALCHISRGHVLIDVVGFSILFVASFFSRDIFFYLDVLFAIISIIMTAGIIRRIYKDSKDAAKQARTLHVVH